MSDDRTDRGDVGFIRKIRIIKWVLKDALWEDEHVVHRHVVRVDRERTHQPAATIAFLTVFADFFFNSQFRALEAVRVTGRRAVLAWRAKVPLIIVLRFN